MFSYWTDILISVHDAISFQKNLHQVIGRSNNLKDFGSIYYNLPQQYVMDSNLRRLKPDLKIEECIDCF
jgi:hypothetical protein